MSKGPRGKANELPERTEWIWHNGEIIPWDDAQLHVMSHVVHYGSSVFEGIRFYDTPQGPAAFRLSDHMRRFMNSARIYRMDLELSLDELADACREVVNRNGLEAGYLRPVALRGLGALGLHPGKSPVETYIVCWPWGQYLGTEALQEGVDVCVSTWTRPAPNTLPDARQGRWKLRDQPTHAVGSGSERVRGSDRSRPRRTRERGKRPEPLRSRCRHPLHATHRRYTLEWNHA